MRGDVTDGHQDSLPAIVPIAIGTKEGEVAEDTGPIYKILFRVLHRLSQCKTQDFHFGYKTVKIFSRLMRLPKYEAFF
jgi:hypothetical protein